MAKDSAIEWTHHTFNPIWGCVKVSDGCKNCYANTFSKRVGQDIWGVDKPRRTFGEKHWNEPLKWNKEAAAVGERHRVFCASMTDVFMDDPYMIEAHPRLWKLIEATPHLDWLLLTKRPENILKMIPNHWRERLPFNVWVGTSVENQKAADERIPHLMKVPAIVRFLSCEPLLGQVNLWEAVQRGESEIMAMDESEVGDVWYTGAWLHWVIVGGESGGNARPMQTLWAESLRQQTYGTGTAFFMKQLGGVRDKRHDLEQFPMPLRVREFPTSYEAPRLAPYGTLAELTTPTPAYYFDDTDEDDPRHD